MTLYQRLSLYCRTHQKNLPTPKQRSDLGVAVANKIKFSEKITSLEHGRWLIVNDYRESDYPMIDLFIQKLYEKNGA